ncbi:helix-turn-helix domain-containing protein [Maricaulis parjimensis]|uniref:helix-turn-helix domain-containing protein n=1 Tax=Maricaulis parjimensis TaxID=144023 RepID=UPI00193A7ADA|nr:AraC family transcriptional regulator [Maricaulis parjimensis]
MLDFVLAIKLGVAAVALTWILGIVMMPKRQTLHIVWAIFCGGLAAVMLREVFTPAQLGVMGPALIIASCASCSLFWLVSRALFRPNAAVGWPQLLLVGGIFAPTVIKQFLLAIQADTVLGAAAQAQLFESLSHGQTLLSSTVLVLSFWEGVRGWSPALPANEKRLRGLFLATFGLCVSTCVMVLDHGSANLPADLMAAIQAICALAILAVTSVAVRYRERHPLPVETPTSRPVLADEAREEAREMARRIRALMEQDAPYLDPDFKVAGLARRLREPDYKISRAITAGLEAPNFNRYVNGWRVEHAKGLLADPSLVKEPVLNIALDSGFASLGPFNRAFKEMTGQTPRDYRKARLETDPGLARLA